MKRNDETGKHLRIELEKSERHIKALEFDLRVSQEAHKTTCELAVSLNQAYDIQKDRAEKAEAELEAARSLIQAALNPEWPARMYQNNDLTRAALAYRAIARRGKGE